MRSAWRGTGYGTFLMSEPAAYPLDLDGSSAGAPTEDFADAMQHLADEAQSGRHAAAGAPVSKAARAEFLLAIGQMIRPLAVGVENLEGRMVKLAAAQDTNTATPDLGLLQATLEGVRGQLGRMANVESANQKLFDALHTELKGYKDGFLFEALQKPFVRDLLALFDDLCGLFSQIEARQAVASTENGEAAFLTNLAQNFDNTRHGLLETFERLDVERQETDAGEPVDKRVHRILGFEPAPEATQGGCVPRSLRPGFVWRGRTVRPEEIVAWRRSDESAAAENMPVAPSL